MRNTGEFRQALKQKNRLVLPAQLRANLDATQGAYLSTHNKNYLELYSESALARIEIQLQELTRFSSDMRAYSRLFYSGLFKINLDKQWRLVMPEQCLRHINLNEGDEIYFLGVGELLEIWRVSHWEMAKKGLVEDYQSISERISFILQSKNGKSK